MSLLVQSLTPQGAHRLKLVHQLEKSIERSLSEIALNYGVSIDTPTLQEGLANLVKKLSQIAEVVVLVDEYDKPIIDNLSCTKTADANRKYSHQNRQLAVIGINFSTQSRNISEWTGKLYSSTGDLLKELNRL
ncbi:MAG: AAA family ATPase [Chlamydiales bacterium]|nr:AAA family ATPase [Chlamydiales bacterium]MCP5492376.1 AAA family ATPase [Chlamydiales bacterium]